MSDSSSASEKVIAKQSVPMRQLTYCSEATPEFHLGSLKEIFDSSIKNNAALSVTGFLIFSGKGFIQILEGPTEGIHEIYLKKICADKRNTNLNILHDCFVNRRNFTDWSMVYQYKDGELSNFGGSVGVDRCRRVARELSFRSGQGEKLFSQYLKKVCA